MMLSITPERARGLAKELKMAKEKHRRELWLGYIGKMIANQAIDETREPQVTITSLDLFSLSHSEPTDDDMRAMVEVVRDTKFKVDLAKRTIGGIEKLVMVIDWSE